MSKVEIVGLEKVKAALMGVKEDFRPYILRDMARKPAQFGVKVSRDYQPIGDTGATARTIGVLKVKNAKQPYVEVGYRGRSLGHIYTSGPTIRRAKRGTIKGFPWLFERAGETIKSGAKAEMKVDISRSFARAIKRRGMGR